MRLLLSSAIMLFVILGLAWQMPEPDAWKEKIQARLWDKTSGGATTEFVIVLRQQADLMEAARTIRGKEAKARFVYSELKMLASRSQAGIIALLESKNVRYTPLFIVNAIRAEGGRKLMKELAGREEVSRLLDTPASRVERLLPDDNPPLRGPQAVEWGVERINADDVWALGYRGEGVVIGGGDTGYKWDHPALISKYRGWNGSAADHDYNWHDAIHELNDLNNYPDTLPSNNQCGLDLSVPCDDQGHGTWTMGIMVGSEGENETGVAPAAQWIGCRNMEFGWGSPVSYLECFEFFLAPTDLNNENPDPSRAPHVINNSWVCPEIEGCNDDSRSLLETGVNNLKASGVFVVVSAGNDGGQGCSSIFYPAAIFENSFTVGGTGQNDTIGNYSSRGPVTIDGSMRLKPNVVAPGSGIRSAARNDGYTSGTGTSAAGPFVAGTVALMISANPALAGEVELLEDILEQTARPGTTVQDCGNTAGTEVPNNTYGYGLIDALGAVEAALNTTAVHKIEKPKPLIYPNPVSGLLTVELADPEGPFTFRLYDTTGRILYSRKYRAGRHRVDLSGLPAGVYFYQLEDRRQQYLGKLIRQ